MAQIWFGDLTCDPIDVDNYLTFKKSMDDLYNDWKKKHPHIFKDFPKVFDIDIKEKTIKLSEEVLYTDWYNHKYLRPFILQGGPEDQEIYWGDGPDDENEIISKYTNGLLKLIGEQGITLYFQVFADDGYEDYTTYMYPNFQSEFPQVECTAEFYDEED